jgi:hypothetical protein
MNLFPVVRAYHQGFYFPLAIYLLNDLYHRADFLLFQAMMLSSLVFLVLFQVYQFVESFP